MAGMGVVLACWDDHWNSLIVGVLLRFGGQRILMEDAALNVDNWVGAGRD